MLSGDLRPEQTIFCSLYYIWLIGAWLFGVALIANQIIIQFVFLKKTKKHYLKTKDIYESLLGHRYIA